jgi:hypothetical protein
MRIIGDDFMKVFFADWQLSINSGNEIGRTKNGEKIAVDQGHTITVIEKDRVFEDELACCRFILAELTKQYKAISSRSENILERMASLSVPVESA